MEAKNLLQLWRLKMRAIVNPDGKIIKLTTNAKDGVEIGIPPQNCGLERLRFINGSLIDLADLSEFYIDSIGQLHSIQITGSQKVVMQYKDRKKLVRDENNNWKVRTPQEIETNKLAQAVERKRIQTKRQLKRQLGHNEEVINEVVKFVLNNDMEAKKKLEQYIQIYDEEK